MSENGKKKAKGKITIICILVLFVIAIAAVGGYFAYQYIEEKKPIEQEWADTYYNFIKGSDEENSSDTKIKNNSKIGFIDVEKIENPVMIVEYKKEEKTYTDIYYINDGKVNNVINLDADNVELLYDINTKQYDWYTHIETETNDTYKKISTQISGENTETSTEDKAMEENTEYTFTKGEEISVETVDGNKIAIPKFDTVFVETEVEVGKVDYHVDMKDKELKTAIIEGVDKYKTEEEMITEEVKNEVINKENEVKEKQEEMKKAEEEKAKREAEEKARAEEEARKKAEEEAAKGLQVGNHTLKYGTYKGTESQYDVGGMLTAEITITLKQDGTYTLKSSNTSLVSNSSGTYNVEKNIYPGISGTHILKLSSGNFYAITGNNTLQVPAGSGATFTYQGN